MDVKCVRVLRPYEEVKVADPMTMFIDEDARYALNREWGQRVMAQGRREVGVVIAPLLGMDQGGGIARASQEVLDALYIEYGEEVILY